MPEPGMFAVQLVAYGVYTVLPHRGMSDIENSGSIAGSWPL